MVFPVVMYRCESWTMKKAECWRIDTLELWCWRRFLSVPWTERRSHQSILKEINPEYSLEGLMLKLTLQYFGHLMQTAGSSEKTPMLGNTEGRRRRGDRECDGWTASRLNGREFEQTQGDSEGQGSLACCSLWGHKESDTTELLNNNRRMRESTQCKVWARSDPQSRTGRVEALLGMTWGLQKQQRLEWMEPCDWEGEREWGGGLNRQGVPRAEILGTRILGSWHADISPSVMGGGFCF